MKLIHLGLIALAAVSAHAADVKVTMNSTSNVMTLTPKGSDQQILVGEPVNNVYSFETSPGEYILTAYKGSTVNGTIDITIENIPGTQEFKVLTITAYATNSGWSYGSDYDMEAKVNEKSGAPHVITLGDAASAGQKTFLALTGNSYSVAYIPSETHSREGYVTAYKSGTVTSNVSASCAIPMASQFIVTVPEDAGLSIGIKFTHFTDFTLIDPVSTVVEGGFKTCTYNLANSQIYNYRTWRPGGLTHAGYFTMNADETQRPALSFTAEDYSAHNPADFNHSPKSNAGYETGDIFMNINPEGFISMNVGDVFDTHAMRTWELTDNVVNNYFFEPDFHYTILDLQGNPSSNVVAVEQTDGSAWAALKALGKGTAIVLVTYDAINVNYYSKAEKKEFTGGEFWGAVWPENTAVFVVSVGESESLAKPNMVINEEYNENAKKNSGKYVDAEHDVFYYLDSTEGYPYSFTPENVGSVEIAYPAIGDRSVSFSGFTAEGVTKDADGKYTVLLKKGRQIVRLTDAAGNSRYQVLTARECHREIINASREGSQVFQPGDKVKIQYSGLYHPANKLAGIYNMSAYVTYNNTPNGSSLIQTPSQYNFGSSDAAQAVTLEIPADIDLVTSPRLLLEKGVLQVTGFGDPIGNHRIISKTAGRSPNFTAIAHQTYFGAIPDVAIDLSPYKTFSIKLEGAPLDADVRLSFDGATLTPGDDGIYSGTYGSYFVNATADGYRCLRQDYFIGDDAPDMVVFNIEMEKLDGAWDGKTLSQPHLDENGAYVISTPDELAWFAKNVNDKGAVQNAVLVNDLHLGNFDWTPIGSASATAFTGTFDGRGHTVSGLYINSKSNYQGLFGYLKDATVKGVVVDGSVTGKQYVGGIAGDAAGQSLIDRCANYAAVSGSATYVGGIVGYVAVAGGSVTNSYNVGNVTGTTNCGGVVGSNNKDAVIRNIFNCGNVAGSSVGGCIGGTTAKNNVSNAFSNREYQIVAGQTLVSDAQMASGEVAYLLGEPFSQTIGKDLHPVFNGLEVFYDDEKNVYYNVVDASEINLETKSLTIDIKEEPVVTLTASYGPEYSIKPVLIWSSSDQSVVTVEHDGGLQATLTARKIGNATIRVEHADRPDVFDTCDVVVAVSSSVGNIFDCSDGCKVDVYDVTGRVIILNAREEDLRNLVPGLYVIRKGNLEQKVLLNN